MCKYILVSCLLLLIAATLIAEAVPVYAAYENVDGATVNEEFVSGILESILDSNVSVAAIRRLFKNVPSITVCVNITYTITCDEEMDCNSDIINCGDGYKSTQIWTLFDTKKYSGELLYYFITTWSTLPGFDWDDACTSIDETINVHVPKLPCLNSTKYLEGNLSYVAKLMHSLSQNKIVTPPFDKEAIEGYSRSTLYIDFSLKITPIFLALCVVVAVFLNISTQQYISKKIVPTQSGKPVFYFQFWAAILMGAVLIGTYFEHHSVQIWLIIGSGTVFNLVLWAIIVYISGNIAENSGNESQYVFSYSSPAATIPCLLGHFLWTIFGHGVSLLLVSISIYAIPNIIIVYYLYPVRTIKRVPLLLSGLFSMISLVARFIYLLEKQFELIKYILCHKVCGRSRQGTLFCSRRQDDDYHFSYYANEIHDDLHKIKHQATDLVGCRGCFSIIIECINLVILMFETTFILFIICVYGFGQVMLAELVFENAGNLTSDNISSVIIAFIPTILVTALTGAGIGLFFKFSIWNLMKQKDITESMTGDQSKNENKERKNKFIEDYSKLDELTNFSIPGRFGYVIKFKRLCSSLCCQCQAIRNYGSNNKRGNESDGDFLIVNSQLSEESENELSMTNARNGTNEFRVPQAIEQPPEIEVHEHP